jgi:ribose transport system permease protein
MEKTGIDQVVESITKRITNKQALFGYAPLMGLIVLVIFFSITSPQFFTIGNLINILRQSAIPLVLMIGESYIIITGAIDLSIEGSIALSGMIVSLLVLNNKTGNDFGFWAVPFGIAIGTTIGFINGFIHIKARIPSFMMTLGTWFITAGLTVVISGGYNFQISDQQFLSLYIGRTLGIPNAVIIAAILLALGWIIQKYTRFGHYLYAIGGSEEIAKMCGINVNLYKLMTFVIAGMFFGVGGVLNVASLGQGSVTVGSFLFPTIAAIVVGGTSISGGSGGVIQGAIGVLFVTALANGMVLLGFDLSAQIIFQGMIILVAVYFTLDRSKFQSLK